MTIVVLLLLAVVWIAVLGPPLMRRGTHARQTDSVTDFQHRLTVLQHAAPATIAAAHRSVASEAVYAAAAPTAGPVRGGPATVYVGTAIHRRPAPARARMCRRRRGVLLTLVGATALFLAAGAVPRLHVLFIVGAVFAALLVAYVLLLVRFRQAAKERDTKLRFIPATAEGTHIVLRRSAN